MHKTFLMTLVMHLLIPSLANAEKLCVDQDLGAAPDGRMLGHLPYTEVRPSDLVAAPAGFALNGRCLLRREARTDLVRLIAAADAVPGLAGKIRAVSCFRTVAHQQLVFCGQIGPGKRHRDAADRARFVGPPGYSEHATGYAIDFGTRPSPTCADVSACFAATAAGRWLLAHAPEFGFELSFPVGNAQSVTWEPWHWRWVGADLSVPGSAIARSIFVRARRDFPAQPTTADTAIRAMIPPPPPTLIITPSTGLPPVYP